MSSRFLCRIERAKRHDWQVFVESFDFFSNIKPIVNSGGTKEQRSLDIDCQGENRPWYSSERSPGDSRSKERWKQNGRLWEESESASVADAARMTRCVSSALFTPRKVTYRPERYFNSNRPARNSHELERVHQIGKEEEKEEFVRRDSQCETSHFLWEARWIFQILCRWRGENQGEGDSRRRYYFVREDEIRRIAYA